MIIWGNTNGTTDWINGTQGAYNTDAFDIIKQLEGSVEEIYLDTDNIPTIGIGYNLEEPIIRDSVLDALGLIDVKDSNQVPVAGKDYLTQMKGLLVTGVNLSQVNALMATAFSENPTAANRATFSLTQTEIESVFPNVVDTMGFETDIDNWLSGIPTSSERAVLLSLAYNQSTANPLLGASLSSAISDGDRAEAWFEIRYRSNGDGVQAKRRYVESQIFGLFDNGDSPSDIEEALLAFRTATKHEKWIEDYEASYGAATRASADSDLTAIGGGYGSVLSMEDSLGDDTVVGSAFKILADEYSDFSTITPDLEVLLEHAGYNGELRTGSTYFKDIDNIWVAAQEQGPTRSSSEVAANTVDRTSDATARNDLIFGNIDASQVSTYSGVVSGEDTLKGGGGNDVFVGGDGADDVWGGANEDIITYLKSDAGVNVFLDGTTVGSGGQGQGDKLHEIEHVIGSNFNDEITGDENSNILYGSVGNDTLNGEVGEDYLIGGKGNDIINGGADKDIIYGQDGDDTLNGDGGNDRLLAGDGVDHLYGGAGQDHLEGGTGTNYLYGDDDVEGDSLWGGSGVDHSYAGFKDNIWNLDINDKVYINGKLFSGYLGDGAGPFEYGGYNIFDGRAVGIDGGPYLAIEFDNNNSIIIENFRNGDGGIWVDGADGDWYDDDYVEEGTEGDDYLYAGAGDAGVSGGNGNDDIHGGSGNNSLAGDAGADSLLGHGGNDTLKGGDGVDTLDGGDGNDTGDYSDETSSITANLATETVTTGDGVETVQNVENISAGSGADTITGDSGSNILQGNLGNDTIDGGGGIDVAVFSGNMASYTFTVSATQAFDVVGTDGTDTVSNIEILRFDDQDVIVDATNTAPVVGAAIDLGSINEDDSIIITAATLLANSNDVDGDTLTVSNLVFSGLAYGSLTDNDNGTWTYQPAENFNGTVDFNFDVADGSISTASSASLTITSVNDAPVVGGSIDLGSIAANETINISAAGLLANSYDVEGDTLSITNLFLTTPADGTLTDNGDGTWTFDPAVSFSGSVGFDFDVSDGTAATASAATLSVTTLNTAPDVGSSIDLGSIADDGTINITAATLLSNSSDVDGDTLSISSLSLTTPADGTLTDNLDGTWTFDPAADFNGSVGFGFDVSDGTTSTPSTASLAVTAVNDTPTVGSAIDLGSIAEDGTLLISEATLLANSADVDGDTLSISSLSLTTPADGVLTDNGDGTWTFDPAADFNGSVGFDFDVSDGTVATASTASLSVTAVNDTPTVGSAIDLGTIAEDGTLLISEATLLANSADVDGDTLSISSLSLTTPADGTLTDNLDGTWTFDPAADFNGSVGFDFDVSDGTTSTPSTASLAVTAVNDAPTVGSVIDLGSVVEDGTINITAASLLANSADVDGDTLSISSLSLTTPADGVLTDNGDGTWTFDPAADFNGSVGFDFDVSDGTVATASTASLSVTAVNDAPTVGSAIDLGSIAEDGTLLISEATLLANSADVDGDTLSATNVALTTPADGTLTDNLDGTWTFDPAADFNGSVGFGFDVSDGTTSTPSTASLAVTASSGNTAPTVGSIDLGTILEDGSIIISEATFLANSTDVDGDTLSVLSASLAVPENGALTDNGNGTWTFTPAADLFGADMVINFVVSDGTTTTAGSALIDVQGVNDIVITGTSGADTLNGTIENDVIDALGGGDTINGGDGDDQLDGKGGADVIHGDAGDDFVGGDGGNDNLYGDAGNDTIEGNNGNDTIYGGDGNDIIDGGAGVDTIYGEAGDDYISGGFQYDILDGGTGNDTIDFTYSSSDWTINLVAETADIGSTLESILNFENVISGDGNDTITGDASDNTLVGNYGDDTILGGDGDDWISGGFGQDVLDGGTGNDTVDYSFVSSSAFTHNLVTQTSTSGSFSETYSNFENIVSGGGDDNITGTAADNILEGNGGDDTIDGQGGDDTFLYNGDDGYDTVDGGTGIDTLLGGSGDDTIGFYSFTNIEAIDGGLGTNVIEVSANATFDFRGVSLSNISKIYGVATHADIYGNDDANTIEGGNYNNDLYGEGGDDTFLYNGDDGYDNVDGGTGIDTLLGGSGDDTIGLYSFTNIEAIDGGLGTNVIEVSANATFDFRGVSLSNISKIYGVATHADIYGNDDANTIEGGNYNNDLYGEGGDDTFLYNGDDGYDNVDGGTGIDTLLGGSGDDTIGLYSFTNIEAIDGGLGTNVIEVSANATFDFRGVSLSNISKIYGVATHADIYGNDDANTIEGGNYNNDLYGEGGDDTFLYNGDDGYDNVDGGTGIDTLLGGSGDDTIGLYSFTNIEAIDGGLGYNIVQLYGSGSIDLTNTTVSNIDKIWGGSSNNIMYGSDGDDVIDGGDGNDTINGGDGDDWISGDFGQDVLDGGAGNDTVDFSYVTSSAFTHNLATQTSTSGSFSETYSNFENLAAGGGDDTITGTASDNILIGNGGDDTIDGGAGSDIAVFGGNMANYTFTASSSNPFTVSGGGEGTDTIENVEILRFADQDYVISGGGAPVVLDLDGDGIELVSSLISTVLFDQDNDGIAERTGWVGADDGLLVLDRNNDGIINNATEISFVDDLVGATTDMEGLVAYDTNYDGLFNANDTQFTAFQIWQDKNQNGVSEAGELLSLENLGIAAIDLELSSTGETSSTTRDNVIVNTAKYYRGDNSVGVIGDAFFRYEEADISEINETIPQPISEVGDKSLVPTIESGVVGTGVNNGRVSEIDRPGLLTSYDKNADVLRQSVCSFKPMGSAEMLKEVDRYGFSAREEMFLHFGRK